MESSLDVKRKVLSFSKKNVTPIVFNYQLKEFYYKIYLAIMTWESVDKGLVFNNQGCNVINKCKKVNGMIKRRLGYRAPTSVSITFYKA